MLTKRGVTTYAESVSTNSSFEKSEPARSRLQHRCPDSWRRTPEPARKLQTRLDHLRGLLPPTATADDDMIEVEIEFRQNDGRRWWTGPTDWRNTQQDWESWDNERDTDATVDVEVEVRGLLLGASPRQRTRGREELRLRAKLFRPPCQRFIPDPEEDPELLRQADERFWAWQNFENREHTSRSSAATGSGVNTTLSRGRAPRPRATTQTAKEDPKFQRDLDKGAR